MEVKKPNVISCGNSSLNILHMCCPLHGQRGDGETPWCKLDKVKFLCPVPGYDRHFKITETFGIEMISVPMDEMFPDMDMVEEYEMAQMRLKGVGASKIFQSYWGYLNG